jgi:predicted nucleic acid-binding protein
MLAYFDSSLLLSILMKDQFTERALSLWEEFPDRVSSILLEAECISTLRRTFNHHRQKIGADWLNIREEKLCSMLEETKLLNVDEVILQVLIENRNLSGCRSLDALHLATALFLQNGSGEPFALCTFDDDMGKLAGKIGFEVRR